MALAAAATAALLYLPSLALPIIYDSLLHIRIAESMDLASVWLPTDKFGFYRPLTFLPLILIRYFSGFYPSWLLHGLNVAQHALNAALLVALSWRLWRRARWALAAGLLLALFPFAYQAVSIYGHNVHLTAAGLTLLALHAYLRGLETGQMRWWASTAVLFVLGLLNHETGVLFGVLAALVQLCYGRPALRESSDGVSRRQAYLLPWLAYVLAGVLYAVVYQWLPISRSVPGTDAGGGLWLETLYLAQGTAYPIAWFARAVPALGAAPAVLCALCISWGLAAWAFRDRLNRSALLVGWGWWGSASLLLLVTLPSDYLLHGPRLLYLGGLGLALLWPVLLEPLGGLKWGALLWAASVGFVLLHGWQSVTSQLERYRQLTAPIELVREVMDGHPWAEGVLVVNLPAWLAPARNTYPVGAEHVAALGHHLFPEELITVNLRTQRPVQALVLPELLGDPGFPYAAAGETDLSRPVPADWAPAGSQVFVVEYTDQGIQARHAGQLGAVTETRPLAQFGSFSLYEAEALACDGATTLKTCWGWSNEELPQGTLSVFVQLLGRDGQLIAQADAPPLGTRFNLIAPVPGWQMEDTRALQPLSTDSSSILVGVYDYHSGTRLTGKDEEQRPLVDDALRLSIQNCDAIE